MESQIKIALGTRIMLPQHDHYCCGCAINNHLEVNVAAVLICWVKYLKQRAAYINSKYLLNKAHQEQAGGTPFMETFVAFNQLYTDVLSTDIVARQEIAWVLWSY